MLRSAAGERPGVDAPISAETVDRLAPPPRAAATVGRHFTDRGFTVLGTSRNSIVVAAEPGTFERHFGVELGRGDDGTYTCRPRRGRQTGRGAEGGSAPAAPRTDPTDPTDVPIDRLPATVRRLVAAVALEASATTDPEQVDP